MRGDKRVRGQHGRTMSNGKDSQNALLQPEDSNDSAPLVTFVDDETVEVETTRNGGVRFSSTNGQCRRQRNGSSNSRLRSVSRSSIDMRMNWELSEVYNWGSPSWKVKLIVALSGVVIITAVALIIHFHDTEFGVMKIGNSSFGFAEIVANEKGLRFVDGSGSTRLSVMIAQGQFFEDMKLHDSQLCEEQSSDNICRKWSMYDAKLNVSINDNIPLSEASCFEISWSFNSLSSPQDCMMFSGTSGDTYGQPVWFDTMGYIIWPRLQNSSCHKDCYDYIPTSTKGEEIGGTIVEPLWLSSQGVALRVSLHSRLEVCSDVCRDASLSRICFKTHADKTPATLRYSVCFGQNISVLHDVIMGKIIEEDAELAILSNSNLPINTPLKSLSERCSSLFKKPLWNIALRKDLYRHKKEIIEDLRHIGGIGGTGLFPELPSVYRKIGDFELGALPNLKIEDFVSAMRGMNFSVMLPVSPFIEFDSINFRDALNKGILVKHEYENAPVLINANQIHSGFFPGILDFTNPSSLPWFIKKTKNLTQKYKIEYLQLLYGEASWLPKCYGTHANLTNSGLFSSLYTRSADYLGSCPITDVAFASQHKNQLVFLKPATDMVSTMSMALGAGLAGYPFFIPNLPFKLDEVGMLNNSQLEDGFIRWVQLVSFFPVAHFPWDFQVFHGRNMSVSRIIRVIDKCMTIRNSKPVVQAIELAVKKADLGHSFIISPLWTAPGVPGHSSTHSSTELFLIEDQFMIGSNLLFTPVLDMGVRNRNVYFPAGTWVQLDNHNIVHKSQGKLLVKNVPVPLEDVLIYVRSIAL